MKSILSVAIVVVCCLFSDLTIGAVNFARLCVAEICLEDKAASVERVTRKFGSGFEISREDDGDAKSYCYYDASNNVWGEFTFGANHQSSRRPILQGITLTTTAICSKNSLSKVLLGLGAGNVRVGQPESEVIQAMGKPDRVDDAVLREKKNPAINRTRYSARFGQRVLVYERKNDIGFVFIFLKAGRVTTIWQSVAE